MKLRGGKKKRKGPYPLGEIPNEVVLGVSKQIVRHLSMRSDISGDGFEDMFAQAIDGEHTKSSLGMSDVVWQGCSWSAKTVKHSTPFTAAKLRLISGRNSPDFSYGISDPRKDVQDTGRVVLEIWNARVDEALERHDELRVIVLVRNMDTREFVLFEEEIHRYIPGNYRWDVNKGNNFVGYEKASNQHMFTWQPHGSQFTIHRVVPSAARKFKIVEKVPVVDLEQILQLVEYDDDWVEFLE